MSLSLAYTVPLCLKKHILKVQKAKVLRICISMLVFLVLKYLLSFSAVNTIFFTNANSNFPLADLPPWRKFGTNLYSWVYTVYMLFLVV